MSLNSALQSLSKAIEEITRIPIPEEVLPDVIGRLREQSRKLSAAAKSLESELPAGVVGERFESTSVSKPTKRSYSADAIFLTVMDRLEMGPMDALASLRGHDALRLTWRWTELVDYFSKNDIRMVVEAHEILDGDLAHVGEVRNRETKVVEIDDPIEAVGS